MTARAGHPGRARSRGLLQCARGRERAGGGRGGAPGSGEPWIACGGARARIAMARTAPAPVSAHDRWWSGGSLRTQARQHRREGGPRRDGGTPTVHAAVPRHISCCVTGTGARARPVNESPCAPVAIHGVRQLSGNCTTVVGRTPPPATFLFPITTCCRKPKTLRSETCKCCIRPR